jgi:hypothetical protein
MKKVICLTAVIWLGIVLMQAQQSSAPFKGLFIPGETRYSGPYFGQSEPGNIPQVFVSGFISTTDDDEYSCTFSPDGTEFYFSKSTEASNRIWYSKIVNNEWTEPAEAPFIQSLWTIEPNFSPDGNKLFFVSDMPDNPPGPPISTLRIWYVERTQNGWTTPALVPGSFSENMKFYPTVASNGNLYFSEVIDNGHASIYRSEYLNGIYQDPLKLDSTVNKFNWQFHPFVAPDETYLLFDVMANGGVTFLHISYRNPDGTWGEGQKLNDTINSTASQYCGYISPDQKYLFFARYNEGSDDLWWVDASVLVNPAGIKDGKCITPGSELYQNYPNPAGFFTTIKFLLKKEDHIWLSLINFYGQKIITLLNEHKDPGTYSVDVNTSGLEPGTYIYQLKSSDLSVSKKLTIIK